MALSSHRFRAGPGARIRGEPIRHVYAFRPGESHKFESGRRNSNGEFMQGARDLGQIVWFAEEAATDGEITLRHGHLA